MNRREIISLIILILVIGFGTYKYLTRSFTELKSQYLMDTIVEYLPLRKVKMLANK